MDFSQIKSQLLAKDKRVIARCITAIESEYPEAEEFLKEIHPLTGSAYRIGITGPPGAGKSTITNQLAKYFRKNEKTVAIIAVDPTSPFTGGALLGDRVRMNDIGTDSGIFIRSMATRGSLGGLSKKAVDTADIFDAAGYDYIIFETVGVGQSELDIASTADTTIVVLVPESGDSVQAMKAGLMEIADFFVMNKSDRPGSDQAIAALKSMLIFRDHNENSFLPTVIKSIAVENSGIIEIAHEIAAHYNFMLNKNIFTKKRVERFANRIKSIVETKIINELWGKTNLEEIIRLTEIENNSGISPYLAAENILINYKQSLL